MAPSIITMTLYVWPQANGSSITPIDGRKWAAEHLGRVWGLVDVGSNAPLSKKKEQLLRKTSLRIGFQQIHMDLKGNLAWVASSL